MGAEEDVSPATRRSMRRTSHIASGGTAWWCHPRMRRAGLPKAEPARERRTRRRPAAPLDPFTLAVLKAHVEMLDQERRKLGPDYEDHGVLFCREDGRPPHPDTITRRFKKLAAAAGLPDRGPGREDRLEGAQQADRARGRGVHNEAVRSDRLGGRPPEGVANTLAELIIGEALASTVIPDEEREDQGATTDGDPGEAA